MGEVGEVLVGEPDVGDTILGGDCRIPPPKTGLVGLAAAALVLIERSGCEGLFAVLAAGTETLLPAFIGPDLRGPASLSMALEIRTILGEVSSGGADGDTGDALVPVEEDIVIGFRWSMGGTWVCWYGVYFVVQRAVITVF